MNDYISTILASTCCGISITLTTYVIVDFIRFASNRYRERYLEEAAIELDDILLQIPPNRILDVSLALSALCGFLMLAILIMFSHNWSWGKLILSCGIAMAVSFPAPRLYLKYMRVRRLDKFNMQLEDGLMSISSSLKAGFSINQALEQVASEKKNPISIEFTLLVQELRLGVTLDDALNNMCKRLDSEDMELVATAIITARQTGGELTQILERLASVIRERMRIHNKLKAITAQGKMQAVIIGAMPFLLLFFMTIVVPGTMDSFYNSVLGVISLIGVIIMVGLGFYSIRKITTIKV